ncbi:hypothetical protein KEM56_006127, partial [Ascosphaera pollenicola]
NRTRPPAPRRRRPPLPNPRTPLQKLRHLRLPLPRRRRRRARRRNHRRRNRRAILPLPPLHALAAPPTAQGRPPQARRAPAIHPLPQGHRPLARRSPGLLAQVLLQIHRRRVQQGVPLQHPARVRRRGRRRESAREG